MTQLIKIETMNGVSVIDSRLLADGLGIEHKSLIRSIRNNQETLEINFGAVGFEIAPREDGNTGGSQPTIAHLNKGQAEFVAALSKNTKQVVAFKARLVAAFNRPKSQIDILVENALALQAQEKKMLALENELEVVKENVDLLTHTIVNQVHELNYYTVSGYYASKRVPAPHNNVLKQLGKTAVQVSAAQSVPVNKAPHEKYGSVNVYRDDVLKSVCGF